MEVKELILDYSKWRCGGSSGIHSVGKGDTALLNKQGYMCCLGQWESQLGLEAKLLLGIGEPSEIPGACDPYGLFSYVFHSREREIRNTKLSEDAIFINDNDETTPDEKIKQLTELLAQHNIELKVINKPS